jgi:hypothetical protein
VKYRLVIFLSIINLLKAVAISTACSIGSDGIANLVPNLEGKGLSETASGAQQASLDWEILAPQKLPCKKDPYLP